VQYFTESIVEQAALAWLESLGWSAKNGPEIAPGEFSAERRDYGQVALDDRFRQALKRFNPGFPPDVLEDAFRRIARPEGAVLEAGAGDRLRLAR
jgi:type I restriction enzyme R subunit